MRSLRGTKAQPGTLLTPDHPAELGLGMDRRNGLIFLVSTSLIYFAAPVTYVGVVQAGLCDRLGASATVANLPSSAYLAGYLFPIFLSWLVPKARERAVVGVAFTLMAISLALVSMSLVIPLGNSIRIATVTGQGLVMGLCASVAQVYMLQCLKRGCTEEGIAKTFKLTYALGPVAAVVGSLLAQWILSGGVPLLAYPYDFAALYLLGVPCMAGIAMLSRRYILIVKHTDQMTPPFLQYFRDSFKDYFAVRVLALSALAYVLFSSGLESISNLSLYTKEAVNRDPKELSGVILVLRFGCKCVAGYGLGVLLQRHGVRAPVLGSLLLLTAGMLWIWAVPGYSFLFAFGLMGGAELGGLYFPAYVLAVSPAATSARNLSILTLVNGVAGFAPALHGALTDHFGFGASFSLGGLMALLSLFLTLKLPPRSQEIHDANDEGVGKPQ